MLCYMARIYEIGLRFNEFRKLKSFLLEIHDAQNNEIILNLLLWVTNDFFFYILSKEKILIFKTNIKIFSKHYNV